MPHHFNAEKGTELPIGDKIQKQGDLFFEGKNGKDDHAQLQNSNCTNF